MSYTVTLGTSSLEMTLDPTANNTVELTPKASIRNVKIIKRGILQLTLQKSHSDDSNTVRNYSRDLVLNIDLTDISNQPTWSSGTLATDKVALTDFNTWLTSASGGGGAGDASAANQVTGNNYLNTIANNSTTSNVNESISLGNLSNIDTSTTAIATNGKISTINSTAITLAISGVYTGTSEDVTQYGYINVAVISDVASATDGLSIQQSSNGTNWDISDNYTIPSGTAKVFSVGRSGKFFRVVYTNGGVIQASFRLQSIFTKGSVKPSSVRPQDGRTNDNDMEENLAYNMLYNGTSWDRSLKGQQTMANSQATTIASNQTPLNVIPTSSSTAAAAGIKGTFTAYGYQRMTLEPKLVFSDPFDGVVVDITNNWTQSGTVTQTGGLASIGNITTTTTVNNLVSKPTFPPSGLNFLVNAFVASFETSPLSTTNVNRFVGFGIHTGTPSVSIPITDGVGFEWDAATSKLYAAVWQNSVRSASSVDLTASVTSSSTRYAVVFRSDLAIFYINSTEIPVASISFVTPNTQILPIRAQTVIGGSTPSTTPNMQIGAIVVGDTGGNATQIADGTFPFRKAKISASGELSIVGSGIPTSLGQQAASTSQPVTLSNEDVNDLYITGQSAQTATINNIIPAVASANATDVQMYRAFAVQVVSTGTGGTYIFEGSNDNVNFQSIPVFNQALVIPVPIVTAITATASQIIYVGASMCRYVRLRIATTITGGSIQAFSTFTQTPFSISQTVVAQGTAANLNVTVASGTVTTVSTLSNTTQLTPGVAATNLGKAEDAANASGDVGIFILGVRNDTLNGAVTSATGDYIQMSADKYGSLIVKDQTRHKPTYSLAFTVVPAAAATDIFQLIGSASKTVSITKINISGTQTTGGQTNITIAKRSTANTGGTSSASTMVPHDSNDSAATAVGAIYTANPTTGTLVGNVRIFSVPLAAITATTNNIVQLDFGERGRPIVLNGVAQALAINLGGATITGGSLNIWIEFIEE